jgi:hypothetical protein
VQCRLVPVNAAVADYVAGVAASLREAGVRVEVASGAAACMLLLLALLLQLRLCVESSGRAVQERAASLPASSCQRPASLTPDCRLPACPPAALAGLSVGKAIRASEKDKIPVMCVIGQREADEGAVAVRTYAEGDLGSMPAAELVARIAAASAARSAVL